LYHSITLGTKNTWNDWHLIPKTRPVVNPPSLKLNYIDIPGRDGGFDMSAALSGRALYNNRQGSWEFIVENGFRDWSTLYSEIMTYLSGQRMTAVLEDDPNYYYEGRFSVNGWNSDRNYSLITIDYVVSPYKRDINDLGGNWIWDTFNFETGVDYFYRNVTIKGTQTVTVMAGSMSTTPIIIASEAGLSVTFKGVSYNLIKGPNTMRNIAFTKGANDLIFKGTGVVSIEYIGGSL